MGSMDSCCPSSFLVGHRMTKNGLGRNNCSLWIVICILLHCFASIFCVIFSCIHWQGYPQGSTLEINYFYITLISFDVPLSLFYIKKKITKKNIKWLIMIFFTSFIQNNRCFLSKQVLSTLKARKCFCMLKKLEIQ